MNKKKSNGMNPRAEPWTQIPGQAPGNLTQKTLPLNPPLLPREGEAEGGGEFIKIAIPTGDGLIVRQQFRGSRGFLVATVKSGKIIHQELRWNLLSEMMTSEDGYFYNLADCDVVIVKEVGSGYSQILETKNITIARTDETEITAAFLQYLKCMPSLSEVK